MAAIDREDRVHDRRRYGRFEIRPAARELLVDGRPASVGARAFDLLLALEARRDRVVGKDELLDVVWPGLVVEENNLAVHVSALRKLLGDDSIKTIPGRGYRFAAALSGDVVREPPPVVPVPSDGASPLPAAALVGRDDDLAALDALWSRARCITIVGAGGIGKTTLARAAAQARRASQPDGVAWAELAEIADASLLPGAVAQAMGLDVAEAADPLPALVAALRTHDLLLVLDNAEHLLEPVARLVRAVLADAPGVQLLVTSQAPLRVSGEQVFRLGPLAVPDDGADAARALAHGAVALFAAQARAADRSFEVTSQNVATVVALCRHLDGVPLALKLAAARLPMLGMAGLAAHLGDRLRLLGHGERDAPARQQTLRAALDWSHALLPEAPRTVFRRLAVFAGGFPLDLVGPVAGDAALDPWDAVDALGELVDRSLVALDAGEPLRYRLPDTAREYARLRLEMAAELAATQQRHAEAVAARMDAAYDDYWTLADQPWLARHAPELDNVRAALDWATGARPALGLGLVASAGVLFMLLGQAPEARRRFAALDAAARAAPPGTTSARYWLERSRLHWGVAHDRMHDYAVAAVAQFRGLGDARGLALALRCAIGSEGLTADEAAGALAEMTALEPPDAPPRLRAQRLMAEAGVLRTAGRRTEAASVSEALVALATQAGLDGMATAALAGLALARLASGQTEAAITCARRLVADPRARRGNFVLQALGTLAEAHLVQGDIEPGRRALEAFVDASRSRDWEWLGVHAGTLALFAACEGRADDAARLLGYAERAAGQLHTRGDVGTARARAQAAVVRLLDTPTLARRMAEGARLDEASACALALARGASAQGPA